MLLHPQGMHSAGMHPAPALVSNGLALCTILSLVLVTAMVRWEEEEGEEAPTDTLGQKKGFFPTFSYT